MNRENRAQRSSAVLRINFNHARQEIQRDYLHSRDALVRGLIGNLWTMCRYGKDISGSIRFEEKAHDQFFRHVLSFWSLEEVLGVLDLRGHEVLYLTETSGFVGEFFQMKMKERHTGYISVTIDTAFYFCVELKYF